MSEMYDVAIIGGGPAGSTVGSMIKKYAPNLRVGIFERDKFPREHVGESLLPTIGRILDEIGVWDDIEAAGFPIKIGATYKWGTTDDLWDFNLLDTAEVDDQAPRPGKFEGWRMRAAFQVERSLFDKILLDHSRKLGCEVFEETGVSRIEKNGIAVEHLTLANGETVKARYYVDASGGTGIMRRAFGVEVDEPAALKNIAIWDYWENAEWAVSIGVGGTRVQVTSLGYGWIWFIPISPTRTSIGLVCPADYYKRSGKRPEELYREAVTSDARVADLLKNAVPDGSIRATKDWSFVARQVVGDNWFLAGESAGFADPILAAGISMTMLGAKECAYTLIDLLQGKHDPAWLKSAYDTRQKQRLHQHIRFANYWYSANAHFTDLMEYTTEIAKEAGFKMDAKSAWQWLGTGGFVSLETAGSGIAGHSMEQIKNLQKVMFREESEWLITKYNVFELQIDGIEVDKAPVYDSGRIGTSRIFRRNGQELPVMGGFRIALEALQRDTTLRGFIQHLRTVAGQLGPIVALNGLEALESMLKDGWVTGKYVKGLPLLRPEDIPRTPNIDWNKDLVDPKVRVTAAGGV